MGDGRRRAGGPGGVRAGAQHQQGGLGHEIPEGGHAVRAPCHLAMLSRPGSFCDSADLLRDLMFQEPASDVLR